MEDKKVLKVMAMCNAAAFLMEELEYMIVFDKFFTQKVKNQMKQTIASLERISNIPRQNNEGGKYKDLDDEFIGITQFIEDAMTTHAKVQRLDPEAQLKFQCAYDNLLVRHKLA